MAPPQGKKRGQLSQNQAKLTERRVQVARMHAAGVSTAKIAQQLGVSQGTISRDIEALTNTKRAPAGATPEQVEKRRWQAWEMKLAGMRIGEISNRCGVSPNTINTDLKWVQRQLLDEPAKEARELDLHRLDTILAGVWEQVKLGNPKAAQTALRVLDRRAAIYGYDAPRKIDATILDVDPADLELRDMVNAARAAAAAQETQILLGISDATHTE